MGWWSVLVETARRGVQGPALADRFFVGFVPLCVHGAFWQSSGPGAGSLLPGIMVPDFLSARWGRGTLPYSDAA